MSTLWKLWVLNPASPASPKAIQVTNRMLAAPAGEPDREACWVELAATAPVAMDRAGWVLAEVPWELLEAAWAGVPDCMDRRSAFMACSVGWGKVSVKGEPW